MCISGPKFTLRVCKPGYVSIGCEELTVADWDRLSDASRVKMAEYNACVGELGLIVACYSALRMYSLAWLESMGEL
jgi:hypothetical protein